MAAKKTATSRLIGFLAEALAIGLLLILIIPPAKQAAVYLRDDSTRTVRVVGRSMYPTLRDGQLIHTEKVPVQRGDIVVAEAPPAAVAQVPKLAGASIIKRVIGIPGDTIVIGQDQSVSVNGVVLTEDYLTEESRAASCSPSGMSCLELTLKPEEYFVLGDNRGNSLDSRRFGPLQESLIKGVLTEKDPDAIPLKCMLRIMVTVILLYKPLEWFAGFVETRLR